MKGTKYKVSQPTYNIHKSWEYNYDHGPSFKGPYPALPNEKNWTFLGHKIISPLGVAAGPLPNAKWLITYAKLGYGTLVQKTVRSIAHESHPNPNIMIVEVKKKLDLTFSQKLVAHMNDNKPIEKLSITNSFGNPCRQPREWMEETRKIRKQIKDGQLFGVSVYGSSREDIPLEELAEDYGKTALLAKKAGAPFIETNLACPNVQGFESPFLYKNEIAVAKVTKAIRAKIGKTPLVLKIGWIADFKQLLKVLDAAGDFEAVSAINTIAKTIVDKNGKAALPMRVVSGVCGAAIKEYGIKMIKKLAKARKNLGKNFEIIGVGGVMTPEDVTDYLDAGADHVQSATAVMWNPYLAYEFNSRYPSPSSVFKKPKAR